MVCPTAGPTGRCRLAPGHPAVVRLLSTAAQIGAPGPLGRPPDGLLGLFSQVKSRSPGGPGRPWTVETRLLARTTYWPGAAPLLGRAVNRSKPKAAPCLRCMRLGPTRRPPLPVEEPP